MARNPDQHPYAQAWPPLISAALRVAFGLIWAVNAALTWTPQFAVNFVGYLHNAAAGQPVWAAWWYDLWIAMVTPHAGTFIFLTRLAETLLALALLTGFARKTTYLLGALFSLLIWSTAEGFGGPYAVGAMNMGAGIAYALIFIALIAINYRGGTSPYSIDYLIEKRWPAWRRVAEWNSEPHPEAKQPVSWRVQGSAIAGIAVLTFFLVAGFYSSMNVNAPTPAAAAAAVSPLMLADSGPLAADKVHDARLPPLTPGDSVDVHLVTTDETVEIAHGVQYKAWTFGGTVPAPVIHVRQGQTVNVTYTNHGMMQHSIDFHAAITPPSLNYVEVMPGETIHFSFVAHVPGAFIYHCGTPPVSLHMANGMYGALIVDPAEPLPPADNSYVIVQGEWYTQQVAGKLMAADINKVNASTPDEIVFNGTAFQYRDHPLTAQPGDLTRIYFVNAGPNLWSAFHIIGGIFDRVYVDGNPANAHQGVSTQSVAPGEGMVFDITLPEAGSYPFVDHSMAHMERGAQGILKVGEQTAKPNITKGEMPAPAAPATPAAPEPSGPYTFDAAAGAADYASTCAACHQPNGEGMAGTFPPLKGNPAVLNPDPKKQIEVILNGLHGEAIDGVNYPTAMPPFGHALSDTQIANIANHERTSWGNQAKQVTADDVKAIRAASHK